MGIDVETVEGSCLYACLYANHEFLNAPSFRTQDLHPRDDTTHHNLDPDQLITN